VVGNLTDDPQLKYLPDGTAAARFTVASNPRVFEGGQWRDGDPVFVPCNAWRALAENAAESLGKGDRVMVTGRLKANTWTTQAGEKRSRLELTVDEVGPSLRFATARPAKTAAPAVAPAQTADRHPTQVPASQANTSTNPDMGQAGPAAVAASSFGTPAQAAAPTQPQPSMGGPARSYRPSGTRRAR
jgi:single-strand DNA-binding protein